MAGLIDANGNIVCRGKEIAYKEKFKREGKEPYSREDIYKLILDETNRLLNSHNLPFNRLLNNDSLNIYISFAGPIDHRTNLVFRPKSIPCMRSPFNLKEEIGLYVSRNGFAASKNGISVFVLHDAATSALGETVARGTLPGEKDLMMLLSGTGVGAGFLKNGKPFYGHGINGLLGEIGYFLVRDESRYHFIGYDIKGDLHIPMGYRKNKVFRHRFSTPDILTRFAKFLIKRKGNGWELTVAKQYLAITNKDTGANKKVSQLLAKMIKNDDNDAVRFLQIIGSELALALATFMAHPQHRREKFINHIVFGGSLSSLSTIYSNELQKIVRDSLCVNLKNFNFDSASAEKISAGFVISRLDATRELMGLGAIIRSS